jgi:hypothetical protein
MRPHGIENALGSLARVWSMRFLGASRRELGEGDPSPGTPGPDGASGRERQGCLALSKKPPRSRGGVVTTTIGAYEAKTHLSAKFGEESTPLGPRRGGPWRNRRPRMLKDRKHSWRSQVSPGPVGPSAQGHPDTSGQRCSGRTHAPGTARRVVALRSTPPETDGHVPLGKPTAGYM